MGCASRLILVARREGAELKGAELKGEELKGASPNGAGPASNEVRTGEAMATKHVCGEEHDNFEGAATSVHFAC